MFDTVEMILIIGTFFAGVVNGSAVTVWLMAGERARWDGIQKELIADRKAMRDAANRVLQAANGGEEHGHSDAFEDEVELREQISEAFVARRPDDVPGPVRDEPIIPVQENPYVFDFSVNPTTNVVHRTDCVYVTENALPLTSMGVNDLIAVMHADDLRGCQKCDPARERVG